MKRVLTVLMALTVLCGMASIAASQDANQQAQIAQSVKALSKNEKIMPEPNVMLSRLTHGLRLNDQQQKQIKPLLEDEYAKLTEIRRNEELSPKTIQKKVQELRTDTKAKIGAFLTPEQQQKYEMVSAEIKAAKQERVKQNRKDRLGTKADPPTK